MTNKLLDIIKFIGCIFVVVIHTRPCHAISPTMDWMVTCSCRWAVPFFFTASSYLFWKSGKEYTIYAKRILQLILIWMVLLSYFIWNRFFSDGITASSILRFVRNLLFGSTFPTSWFMTALLEGIGIVWLLKKWLNNRWLLLFSALAYLACVAQSLYYPIVGSSIQHAIDLSERLINFSNSFVVSLIYIVIGKIFAEEKLPVLDKAGKRVWIVGLIFCIAIAGIECYTLMDVPRWKNDTYLTLPIMIYMLFRLMLQSDKNIGLSQDICIYLRHCSTIIYLCHFSIMLLIQRIYAPLDWKLFIMVFATALLLSTVLQWTGKKINFVRRLY